MIFDKCTQHSWAPYPRWKPQSYGKYLVTVSRIFPDCSIHKAISVAVTGSYEDDGYLLSTNRDYEKVIAWMPCPKEYGE